MVQQIFAMTWKELKVFFKDPGAVMLILLQPLMFILIMSYAMSGLFRSGDSPIRILVVNEDSGKEAMTVVKDLGMIQGFQAETTWEGKSLDRQTAERLIIQGKRNLALFSLLISLPSRARPCRTAAPDNTTYFYCRSRYPGPVCGTCPRYLAGPSGADHLYCHDAEGHRLHVQSAIIRVIPFRTGGFQGKG